MQGPPTFLAVTSPVRGSVVTLSRTQALLGHFRGWRKGLWGGQKSGRKKVEPSLVPLRANRGKFSPPHDPLRSARLQGRWLYVGFSPRAGDAAISSFVF